MPTEKPDHLEPLLLALARHLRRQTIERFGLRRWLAMPRRQRERIERAVIIEYIKNNT